MSRFVMHALAKGLEFRDLRVQHRIGGMQMGLKIEAECGIRELLVAGCGMKI